MNGLLALFLSAAPAALPPPGQAVRILPPRQFPGWQSQNVVYPCVVADGAGYRMFYTGSASEQWNDSVAEQWVTGYVTSTDTLTWKHRESYEQVLFARKLYEGDLLDPAEMAAAFDSMHASGACVIKDGALWKAWYTGWNGQTEHLGNGITRKINFRIGYATSSDGTQWTKTAGSAGAGAVVGLGDPGEPDAKGAAHPHVLKTGGSYRMWYEAYDGQTWRILYATSADGVSWSKQGLALGPGGSGVKDEQGLRNPLVFSRGANYELWYQGRSNSAPNYHILRATSPDGITWTKVSQEVVLHPTPPLAGDESILADSAIVQPDNSVQVFFAKETISNQNMTYGTVKIRNYSIYTEVVNP